MIGGAAISTKNDLDDDTQLWHLRLGHMSERAMQELHKQKLLKGVHSCKLDTANIVPWGSSQSAYALIPGDERTKLKLKSLECIFLGFESGVKGFKLWDLVNWKKILNIDVVFDEKTMSMIKVKKPEANEDVVWNKVNRYNFTKYGGVRGYSKYAAN
ncbi:PREDICTED: LOW QUALITY PROTEIN [Prunus dulcis]|uniref:PREDICTED: LOW QUALITY PROTEIN n=1 Tax=Prunus dulcis TaxID=3755 RepID=A0A5E4GEQ8_PRUDU|nr:PREDICTED: LOW QUALITY PROTEIN [Prunus dulcis]